MYRWFFLYDDDLRLGGSSTVGTRVKTFLLAATFAKVRFWGGSVYLCGVGSFEVFPCCVVSFSKTLVILPNVLVMSLPFSLFARA